MSGTEIPYHATRDRNSLEKWLDSEGYCARIVLRAGYALSGTDVGPNNAPRYLVRTLLTGTAFSSGGFEFQRVSDTPPETPNGSNSTSSASSANVSNPVPLTDHVTSGAVCPYGGATGCPVLTYAVSDMDLRTIALEANSTGGFVGLDLGQAKSAR